MCDCFSTRHAVVSDPNFSKDQADSILTWQLDPEEIEIEHVQLNERVIAACQL